MSNAVSVMMAEPSASSDPGREAGGEAVPPERKQFSQLMRQHHRELVVYASAIVRDHHAGQDMVQEAFVSAYLKFDEFDRSEDFGAWMRGFVRNKCRDWFRKQKRVPLPSAECCELEVDIASWQAARAAGVSTVFEALESCLEGLPEKLSEAVRGFYLEDKTGDDAAQELGINPTSLRKRLERAREKLHDCISRKLQPQNLSHHA